MNYSIVQLSWERVLLCFDLKAEGVCREFALFLEDQNSGKRFLLRPLKTGLQSAESTDHNEVYSFTVNVTNPGTCRCLPDGDYRVIARGQDGSCREVGISCSASDAEKQFRFNNGKDSFRISAKDNPFRLRVRTVYGDRKRKIRNGLFSVAVTSLYRVQRSFLHTIHSRKQRSCVLFLSGQSEVPGGNLTAVRDRMIERGMTGKTGSFMILESYRDRSAGLKNLLNAVYVIALADYIFVDDYEPLLDYLVLDKRTVLTQLWHAGVGFKSSGYSRWGLPGGPAPFNCHRQYTYGVVGSKAVIPIFSEIWGINDDQVLPLGLPRIDLFLNQKHRLEAVRIIQERYPVICGRKVILFAPTYRGSGKMDAEYPYEKIDFSALYDLIGDDMAILFRMHPWVKEKVPIPEHMKDRMADAGDYPDINDLFYVTDLLITDYSSNICEFSLMQKPMLFYAFDEKQYASSRGFHRDYVTYAPGKVCHTFNELARAIRENDYEPEKAERCRKEQFDWFDTGASDRVIDRVLLGKAASDNMDKTNSSGISLDR